MGTPRRAARMALALPVITLMAACGTTVPQTNALGSGVGAAAIAQGGSSPTAPDTGLPVEATTAAPVGAPTAGSPDPAMPGSVGVAARGASAEPAPGQPLTPGEKRATPSTTGGTRGTGSAASASAAATPGTARSPGAAASKAPATAAASAASTGPIKIGFDYFTAASSQAANSAAGIVDATSLTPDGIFDAFVASVNAHGGLGGRQITPVLHSENDMSSSFATDAQAACQYFTQDAPVPIVVDAAWGAGFGFNTCLTQAGVEDVSLPQAPDGASLSANPFQVNPGELTPDRAYSAALVQLVRAGTLKAGAKIGVFTDKCPTTVAAYTDTIGPEFKKLGLVPDVFSSNCIGGYDGLGGASTDTASAILQFRGNGDTQVMMISANDPTYWELYAVNAVSQQYNTGLIMTSYSQASALEANFSTGQKSSIHGVGWIPVLDTDNPKLPGTPAETTCDSMAAAEGLSPGSNDDEYSLYTICAPVLLLKAAFASDQANGTAARLSKAIAALGTSFSAPGVNGGQTDFSRQDAVADVQLFGYQAGCSCLAYSGSPTPA